MRSSSPASTHLSAFFPGLKAFTAAVMGGIGNLTGALLGGIVLGMLETFAGSYLSVLPWARRGGI
jgi:branched-chain amino acid transport system permease protein